MSAAGASTLPEGSASNQYLSFMLDDAEYALDILKVREIRGWDDVTPMPDVPDHVLGVIDLRGIVIPIVDLRLRFGLETLAPGPTTVVIVVTAGASTAPSTVGMVVDAVSEVYSFTDEEQQPPPTLGGAIGVEYVKGIAKTDERLVILLDLERLMGSGLAPCDPLGKASP